MNAEACSLVDVMDHWAQCAPHRAAFIFVTTDLTERTVITFGQLMEMGTMYADVLKMRGVRRDDRVCVYLPNCPERAVVEAGLHYLGAVSVNGTCKAYDVGDLVYILRKSHATTLIIDSDYSLREWDTLRKEYVQLYGPGDRMTAVKIPNLRLTIHIKRKCDPEKGDFMYDLQHFWKGSHTAVPPSRPEFVCTILTTAAGEGRYPKLAVQTHRNMIAAARLYTPRPDMPNTDRYFMNSNLGSADGHFALTLYSGVTRVLMNNRVGKPKYYEKFMYTAIRHELCQTAVIPPSIAPALAKYFMDRELDELCFNKLKFVWLLGDRVTKAAVEGALKFSSAVFVAYTSCELNIAAVGTVQDADKFNDFCCGRPVPNAFMRVVDEEGKPLLPLEKGSVEIRSPLMFKEYLFDPEENKAALTEDGYLRTGDTGWLDSTGQLYVERRQADLITFQGQTVDPSWMEAKIRQYPGVLDAVIVVADNGTTEAQKEAICMCVVVNDSITVPEVKFKIETELYGTYPEAEPLANLKGWIYYLRFEGFPLKYLNKIDRVMLARQSAKRIV